MERKRFDLDEITGSDIDENVMRILKSSGNVERSGEWNEDFTAVRSEREIVESGCSELKASRGGADIGEAVLKKVNFHICLFLNCLQLFDAHSLQSHRSAGALRRSHL